VRVAYRGRPRPITDPDGSTEGWMATPDGAIALNQPVGALSWYPNNDTPADKAAYDVRVRVPAGLEVASTGVLASRRTAAGLTTWHWRTAQPTPPELSMLAIGQFRQHRARTSTGVPLHSFTDARLGDAAGARGLMAQVLPWLEGRLGAYPFDAAGIVVDGYSAGYALETQTRPVFPGSVEELTLVHELGHQWFGGSVTPRRWDDIWLNEGWATFVEWWWTEHTGGPTAARQLRAAYSSRGALDPFWDVPPAEPGSARDLYHEAVYLRGAMTLQVLRERIGEADFARLARRWVGDHRHGTVTTADLTALAEEVSGEQLDALFEDWLRTPGRPSGY
jgi:aminopeptidase N